MAKKENLLIGLFSVCALGLLGMKLKLNSARPAMAGGQLSRLKRVSGADVPRNAFLEPMDETTHAYLARQKLKNPGRSIASAIPLKRIEGSVKKLDGRYSGFVHSEVARDDLEFKAAIAATSTKRGVVGMMAGKMGNRKAVRNFKFMTAVSTVRGEPGQAEGTLLQTGPRNYVQLFYLEKDDRWVGNCYRRGRAGKIEYVGVTKLTRE